MAKKEKKESKRTSKKLPENLLPQNILPMGERVEQDKNIYISQSVYKEIHRFTKNKTTNESGGMLVGTVIQELGKTNVVISGFVEAKYTDATPTTLTFTHETWDYVHKEIEKKHKGKKILGWIHTHPDFGIFLSEYDKFIHQNFFSDEHQVAYVVDPIQKIEGFYFWINGNLEKCKGFYVYDKNGVQINVNAAQNGSEDALQAGPGSWIKNVLIGVLAVAVVLLSFAYVSASGSLNKLEKKQKRLETQIQTQQQNQAQLANILSVIITGDADAYRAVLQAGLIQAPTVPEQTPEDTVPEETTNEVTEETEGEAVQ